MVGKLKISALFVIVAALAMVFMGQTPVKSLIINASGDSYVVTDISDDEDPQWFRDTNDGSLEFLKTWYAWGVIEDERLLSVDLVKFDLQELEGLDIESVSLQLFARQANISSNNDSFGAQKLCRRIANSIGNIRVELAWDLPANIVGLEAVDGNGHVRYSFLRGRSYPQGVRCRLRPDNRHTALL